MKNIHRQFLSDSVKKLKDLQQTVSKADVFSDAERQKVFRTLHTIKGTAQTFGFSSAGRLAHELENLLSAEKMISPENFQSLFAAGIEFLISSFEREDFEFPTNFIEKIYLVIPADLQSANDPNVFSPEIPREISECLSQSEKIALTSALDRGKTFYNLEVGFETAVFTVKLTELHEILSEIGEIIATFPSARLTADKQIGFQILFAGDAERSQIEKIAADFAAQIELEILPQNSANDLPGVLSKVAAHGKNLARKLDKQIEFEISAADREFPAENLQLVFEILLHLVRNAVDHAVEKSGGKVEIYLKAENDGWRLTVADNGRGVDLEKLKAGAVEKNIISADEKLTEQATLDLIFQSELSTAPRVTEISGRGIGLDAVKNAVENSGGKIKVRSRNGQGTTFEIFLPR